MKKIKFYHYSVLVFIIGIIGIIGFATYKTLKNKKQNGFFIQCNEEKFL